MLERLLQEQFGIAAGRQADEADFIRQILRDPGGAGADRAGAAEENNVFHSYFQAVKTWRKYKYIRGALNSRLSSKSRIPPMPGKNFPESFTPASRLKVDSMRSPTTAEMLRRMPSTTAWLSVMPANRGPARWANSTLAPVETTMAPPNPSHVLPG